MEEIKIKVIGHKIQKVVYSEVNDHDGKFYYDGFDILDHGINVQMENGYWWNLCWKDEEYFEFGEGRYDHNQYLNSDEIKSWEATERWNEVLSFIVTDFSINFIDEAEFIPAQVSIVFDNGRRITIMIAEALNLDESIPTPLEYEFGGKIYVFHNEDLLKEIKTDTNIS
ncbi:hypothetical protein WJR50_34035 [Catalinimonas sp. 4WD22]|uniref:hypothetical protein n=1 Tax=Catalinimonas locisalis TaxID=3133978 RepID=UPI0031013590